MKRYDTVIVGAGHNGLVCAAYLAQAGQSVLVLEAAEQPGGFAARREFYPGFQTSVAHTLNHFSSQVARDLKLQNHGYLPATRAMDTVALDPEGDHVSIGDLSVTGVSGEESADYVKYREMLKTFARTLEPFWNKTMPGIGENSLSDMATFAQLGLRLRLMGRDDMLEFLRVATLPMRDLMDDNFDNKLLQAALAWDGIIGSKLAPRSPNQSVFTLLYRMCGDHDGMHSIPEGGINTLVQSLVGAAATAGAELRCSAPVRHITVEGDEDGQRVSGVVLADGEEISAGRVVSAIDPQSTFLRLVGAQHLEIEFTNRISRLRCEGFVAKLHLALDGLPQFSGLDTPAGRMIIAPELDAIEFAFDDAKHGGISENPVLEVTVPSLHDSALAPAGQHVLSAHVMYVPAKPKGGWTDAAREGLIARLMAELERYAPGIGEQVLATELLTPADMEKQFGITGGHWHHTEFAVDQMLMMRPTYEAAQYGTPIPGLFLCGAGSHPGGGITGMPGQNAAREILR
ncbi:MAG: NAD(P)/FAD-dependent oxidoreductase [Pseudomonadota bacterium]